MSYSLLGAHVNATVSGLADTISAWKPPLVVLLDHSDVWHQVKAASPKTTFVGRLYVEFQPDFNAPLDPIQAARRLTGQILPLAERMGTTVSYWQGVNEPAIDSAGAMARYAEFEAERARLLDAEGFKAVVGSFAVGNPPHLSLWQPFLPALEAARQFGGALALHEYGWPRLENNAEWLLLRHRKLYAGDPREAWDGLPTHLNTLPLFITECGLDGLLEAPDRPRGWRELYDAAQYLAQLDWYDRELRQDTYVAGAAVYCCGNQDLHWASYDVWPGAAGILAAQATPVYPLFGPVPPIAPPQPPAGTQPAAVWTMRVEQRAGPSILAGTFPEPGIALAVRDPWGNTSTVTAGSKPEHGPGGFEVLAPHAGQYRLAFLDQSFDVTKQAGVTFVTFARAAAQPPAKPPLPETEEARLALLLQRLDTIIALLQERVPG